MLGPGKRLKCLNPFEVGNRDPAGVGQDVRDDEHVSVYRIASASGVVGPLAASAISFAWIRSATPAVILILQCRGD